MCWKKNCNVFKINIERIWVLGGKETVKKRTKANLKEKERESYCFLGSSSLSLSSSSVQSLALYSQCDWNLKGVRFRVFARFLSRSTSMSSSSQSFSAGRPSPLASPSQSHRFCGPSATSSGGGSLDTLNRVIADLCSHGNPKVMNAKILLWIIEKFSLSWRNLSLNF